jgi:two-component SAPR family response regulator
VFWEGMDPKKASSQLRTSISYMRKSFSDLGLNNCCQFRNGRYFIDLQNIKSDYTDFRYLILKINNCNFENKILYSKMLCKIYNGEFCSDIDNIEFLLIASQIYNEFKPAIMSCIYELIHKNKFKQALYFIEELLKYDGEDQELISLKIKLSSL